MITVLPEHIFHGASLSINKPEEVILKYKTINYWILYSYEIMKWLRCLTNRSPHNVAILEVKNLSYSGPSSLLPDPLRCKCLPANSHHQRLTPATVLHDNRLHLLKLSKSFILNWVCYMVSVTRKTVCVHKCNEFGFFFLLFYFFETVFHCRAWSLSGN